MCLHCAMGGGKPPHEGSLYGGDAPNNFWIIIRIIENHRFWGLGGSPTCSICPCGNLVIGKPFGDTPIMALSNIFSRGGGQLSQKCVVVCQGGFTPPEAAETQGETYPPPRPARKTATNETLVFRNNAICPCIALRRFCCSVLRTGIRRFRLRHRTANKDEGGGSCSSTLCHR